MQRIAACIVVMGIVAGIGNRAFAQQADPAHAEYRRAAHKAANHAVGALIESGPWNAETGLPRTATAGNGALRYFRAPQGYAVSVAGGAEGVLGWLRSHAAAFGLYTTASDLYFTRYTQSETRTFLRFGQTYGGVPVHGAEIIVQTLEGTVEAIFADVLRDTYALDSDGQSLTPLFGPEDAEAYALADAAPRLEAQRQARLADLERVAESMEPGARSEAEAALEATEAAILAPAALTIFTPDFGPTSGQARLAYRTIVRSAPALLLDEFVYIDARTGETLDTARCIRNAVNRSIYDVNGATTTTGFTATRAEGNSPVSDPEVDGNYDLLGAAYAYFNLSSLGYWTSYDDADSPLHSYADWGSVGYAAWDPGEEVFHFGQNGYGQADDIVGHEYAHAVLDHAWPGHDPDGETGAIAESICDFFGELIDWYNGGDNVTNRWKIGEDLTGGVIRNMANPGEFDQPSYYGSSIYYHGANDDIYVHVNSGVGNLFWKLVSDGGTHREVTVTGLGSAPARTIAWECVKNTLTDDASYFALFTAARNAAYNLYDSGSTPTLAAALAAIDGAGAAVGIADIDPQGTTKSSSPPGPEGFEIIEDFLVATTSDGYVENKSIPYKVYIPGDGRDLGDRGDANWPLDVIILVHGAGMGRRIGLGFEDPGDSDAVINEDVSGSEDVDGIALYWAKQGYIVVAPSFLKRRTTTFDWGPFGTHAVSWWQKHEDKDGIVRVVQDLLQTLYIDPDGFYAERIRDLAFVQENLDSILNLWVSGQEPYEPGVSKIAIAGHSLGAVTTMLAAGAPVTVGNATTTPWQLHLEDYGFRREFDNGTSMDTDDDWGAFVPADAYLVLDGSFVAEASELQVIDDAFPNQTGRTYVRNPLMVATAEADPGTDLGTMDPVVNLHTINEAPAYGVLVAGANHLTAVTTFERPGVPIFSWSLLPQASTFLFGTQDGSSDETDQMALTGVADLILDELRARFTGTNETNAYDLELDSLDDFRRYTIAFFDAHLSGMYDELPVPFDGTSGYSWLLDTPLSTHNFLLDFNRRYATKAFVVRDASGFPLAQFQSDGNIVLNKGGLDTCFNSFVVSGLVSQFFIKKHDGTIAAEIDDFTGNLRLRSTYAPLTSNLAATSAKEFVVRNDGDTGADAQIVIDDSGALKLRGRVYTEGNVAVSAVTSCGP